MSGGGFTTRLVVSQEYSVTRIRRVNIQIPKSQEDLIGLELMWPYDNNGTNVEIRSDENCHNFE